MHIGFYEILGGILLFLCVAVSRSTELMGAELVLPIIKIAFNFKHKESVELAAPAIWLSVLIKFIAAMLRKDERYKDRKVIDFKFAAVIMPLVLIGAFWGEVIHGTVAPIIESAILALVIGYLLFKTFVEIIKEYKEHKEEMTEEPSKIDHTNEGINGMSDSLVSQEGSPKITRTASINKLNNEMKMYVKDKNMLAINSAEEENSLENIEEHSFSSKQIINDGKYDEVYKPRYIKRGIPILIMIVLLSKFKFKKSLHSLPAFVERK